LNAQTLNFFDAKILDESRKRRERLFRVNVDKVLEAGVLRWSNKSLEVVNWPGKNISTVALLNETEIVLLGMSPTDFDELRSYLFRWCVVWNTTVLWYVVLHHGATNAQDLRGIHVRVHNV
jgi:hypothetical protein